MLLLSNRSSYVTVAVTVAAALIALLLALAARSPAPPAKAALPFVERYPAIKPLEPHSIRTIPIIKPAEPVAVPAPVPAAAPVMVAPPVVTIARREPVAEPVPEPVEDKGPRKAPPRRSAQGRDICTAHGLRKVVTRGGRSWNCRRGG
jgi:hypothetical protein